MEDQRPQRRDLHGDAKTQRQPRTEGSEVEESINRLSARVIGAAIEVHRRLGPGFLESVYEEALAIELRRLSIRFERQVSAHVSYRDTRVGSCRLDFLIEGQLVVELKAVESLSPVHRAQVISYLRVVNAPLGLLMNFNAPVLRDGLVRLVNRYPRGTHARA